MVRREVPRQGVLAFDHLEQRGLFPIEVLVGPFHDRQVDGAGPPAGVELSDRTTQCGELGLVGRLGGHDDARCAEAVRSDHGSFEHEVGVAP